MRTIKLYTGVGGLDMFQEALENELGIKRIYIGKKVLRILRKMKTPIKKSLTGRYYRNIPSKVSLASFLREKKKEGF